MSTTAYLKQRRRETLTTTPEQAIEFQDNSSLHEPLSTSEFQPALPLIRLDHAWPHTFQVATSSAGDDGVRLLLALGGAVSASIQRYADKGPHGLPSGSVYVQMGLGTGRCDGGIASTNNTCG